MREQDYDYAWQKGFNVGIPTGMIIMSVIIFLGTLLLK